MKTWTAVMVTKEWTTDDRSSSVGRTRNHLGAHGSSVIRATQESYKLNKELSKLAMQSNGPKPTKSRPMAAGVALS